MLLSFVSIYHCLRVCCTEAIRLWLNVFVIKHYWLPQSITLATVVPLSSLNHTLQRKGGLSGQGRAFSVLWVGFRGNAGGLTGSRIHVCICVWVYTEIESLYSVFNWSIFSHFNHKSNNSRFLSSCSSLVIKWLYLFFPPSVLQTPPLYCGPFHHFSFTFSSGINQACSCVAWLHYIIMKFSLRCSEGNGLAWE